MEDIIMEDEMRLSVGTIVKSRDDSSTGYIRERQILRGFWAVRWTAGPRRGKVDDLVPAEELVATGSLGTSA